MLPESLPSSEIENVYLYVADAVRDDYLSDKIGNLGRRMTSIAGGIHSPTSFATIVSGTYFPKHGVSDFTDKLGSGLPNILHTTSHESAFVNTINHRPFNHNPDAESIITNTLDASDSPSNTVENIQSPFLIVERGPGGHAPYGDFGGDGAEYFRDRGAASRSTFSNDYKEAIQIDTDWFLSQLDKLKERDLLEKTLVIYTSDHGELLGEMGMVGHNAPIHRRLVETPCVFIHPDLPTDYIEDGIVRQVDLVPTISSIADIEFDHNEMVHGVDLSSEPPATLGASFYDRFVLRNKGYVPTIGLSYESVWDRSGGYVFRNSGHSSQLAAWLHSLVRGSKKEFRRAHAKRTLRSFLAGNKVVGTPHIDRDEATRYLDEISQEKKQDSSQEDLEVPKDRLRELGYVD
jgi:hypothetical protein